MDFGSIQQFLVRFIKWLFQSEPPTMGIYHYPGNLYVFKLLFIYILLSLRKLKGKWSKEHDRDDAGYGKKSRATLAEMEQVQPLSKHPKAIDAVYFNSANQEGFSLVTGMARRPQKVINGFLILKIPELGTLLSPKLPDTMLFAEHEGEFSAEGINCTLVEPMQKWRISYHGPMKLQGDIDHLFHVKLDVIWSSSLPVFDCDTDIPTWTMAKAIATEPWSRKFFNSLKEIHQTHYEQLGVLDGKADVNGISYELHLDSMRDHSYGLKREWKMFHRYGLQTFALENGMKGHVAVVKTVTMISFGYLWLPSPDGSTGHLVPVDDVDLPLWQHGEEGIPPTDYGLTFWAGGQRYDVQVQVQETPELFLGWEWEARILERIASFQVNGINGWGVAEWHYNYRDGRPREVAGADPDWTHTLVKG